MAYKFIKHFSNFMNLAYLISFNNLKTTLIFIFMFDIRPIPNIILSTLISFTKTLIYILQPMACINYLQANFF